LRTLRENQEISVPEAIRIMEAIAFYRDQHSALAIVYLACNDTHGEANLIYLRIIDD
jgi:hypothetical protein